MTPANVVLNGCDLDNAIDAAIEQQANSVYHDCAGVDCWDAERDARS